MVTQLTAPAGATIDTGRLQRRTLGLLGGTQIVGGIGLTIGITVGALLAARIGGTGISGLAQSAAVVGGALLAVPATRIMQTGGRRAGLALAYLVGAVGGVLVVVAAVTGWVPLLFLGMLLFGGGTTANLQARYSAADLAPPARRGRHLSLVVWATTIGSVVGPNITDLADRAVAGFGLPPLAGPFVFGSVAFLVCAAIVLFLLRPDPLLTARRIAAGTLTPAGGPAPAGPPTAAAAKAPAGPTPAGPGAPAGGPGASAGGAGAPAAGRPGIRQALQVVLARPAARLGVVAVAVGHLVMIGVMAMTPVHIGQGHGDADVLRIIGIVLSVHIAGMFALAPIVGWLTDRLGRRIVILGGVGLLLAACAVAGTAGHSTPRLTVGLFLLGLGWSGTMVAGSTLLSESVPVEARPAVQGLSDLTMGLAGALAGALSGFVVEFASYPVLNLLAAVAVVPLVALALRPAPAGPAAGVS